MTTPDTAAKQTKTGERFRLPDPPEREPNDMTSAEHLRETGLQNHSKQFLGNPDASIVSRQKYITAKPGTRCRNQTCW